MNNQSTGQPVSGQGLEPLTILGNFVHCRHLTVWQFLLLSLTTKAASLSFTLASVSGRLPQPIPSQMQPATLKKNYTSCICTFSLEVPFQIPHEIFFAL
jgi:hypothetical protein